MAIKSMSNGYIDEYSVNHIKVNLEQGYYVFRFPNSVN